MSFILRRVAQRAGGGDIVRVKAIGAAEPVIGRGADCDIQIPDLAVSLRHAVMRQPGRGRVEVKALGQLGFEANGTFTKAARLSLADRPRLIFGSHELNLAPGDDAGDVVVTLSRSESAASEPDVQDEKTVFRLAAALFSRRRAAWTLGAALLALCLILPVAVSGIYRDTRIGAPATALPRADAQWEGGPLSLGHRFLEGNCQACHQKPFVAVRDDACLACHKSDLSEPAARLLAAQTRDAGSPLAPAPARDHAAEKRLAKARPMRDDVGASIQSAVSRAFDHPDGRCESCHTEHIGAVKMSDPKAPATDQLAKADCAGCHANLTGHLPDTTLLDVADWERHPDFRPLIATSKLRVKRIALSSRPAEDNELTFPHDLHLSKTGSVARQAEGLGGAKGYGAPLDCGNCHRPDDTGRYYRPVEMVRDCSACHSLAYGNGGAGTMMLKHGDPKRVVQQLKAFYASGGGMPDMNDPLRRRPGFDRMPTQVSAEAVARRVRAAFVPDRPGAFLRGGVCYGCHAIVQPRAPGSLDFDVVRPRLATRYMPRGGFDHGLRAHRVDAGGRNICGSCHKAESSTRSADVLLPQIARCAACHGEPGSATPASDSCSECHSYHQPALPAALAAQWSSFPVQRMTGR